MSDEIDFEFDQLVDEGCFIANGDVVIVDWPKLRALHPSLAEDLWADHTAEIDDAISSLVDRGLLHMTVVVNDDGSMEARYSLTDLGREVQLAYFEVAMDDLLGLDKDE